MRVGGLEAKQEGIEVQVGGLEAGSRGPMVQVGGWRPSSRGQRFRGLRLGRRGQRPKWEGYRGQTGGDKGPSKGA
jgi:hypothetical protein